MLSRHPFERGSLRLGRVGNRSGSVQCGDEILGSGGRVADVGAGVLRTKVLHPGLEEAGRRAEARAGGGADAAARPGRPAVGEHVPQVARARVVVAWTDVALERGRLRDSAGEAFSMTLSADFGYPVPHQPLPEFDMRRDSRTVQDARAVCARGQ